MQNLFISYLLIITAFFFAFVVAKVIGKLEMRLMVLKSMQRLVALKEAKIKSGRLAGNIEMADLMRADGYIDAMKDITKLLTNKREQD